eukprot:jgi/Tetstr1/427664/TSEL_017789.t1
MVLRAAGTLSRPITTALLACALLLLLAAAAATGGDADSKMFALPRRAGSRYITRTVTRDTSELKRVDSGEQIATPRAHHAPSGWPTGGLDAGARTGGDPEVQDPADKEAYIRELLREVERQTTEMASGNLQWARGVGLPELIAGIPSPDTRIQLLHEVLEEQKEVMAARASLASAGGLFGNLTAPETRRSQDLKGAAAADAEGYCTWEALARSSEGKWLPSLSRRDSPPFHSSCLYLKERYKCEDRDWRHPVRWIPDAARARDGSGAQCRLMLHLGMAGLAERAGRPINVLILGNSLLRELYETVVCTYQAELQSYTNFAHHDDFSVSMFDHMEVIYEFRDYDSAGLGPWLRNHTFGEGRSAPATGSAPRYAGETRQAVDLVITNYQPEHLGSIYSALFAGYVQLPPAIYVTHACARGRSDVVQHVIDYPKEMAYAAAAREAGLPVFDLCSMSKAAIDIGHDVQARKKGREGDPHLCLPGPHSDMMTILFQMAAGLLEQP